MPALEAGESFRFAHCEKQQDADKQLEIDQEKDQGIDRQG